MNSYCQHTLPTISVITLGVQDLVAATRFYQTGLALTLSSKHSKNEVSFFALQGTWLALYPRQLLAQHIGISSMGSGFSGVALAHNVATKQRVDELLTQVSLAGATITRPAQTCYGEGYAGFFTDLDGYCWEIVWNPRFSLLN
ncbi:MAG: VOC family protein [Gammaproteobacteria bacterium]